MLAVPFLYLSQYSGKLWEKRKWIIRFWSENRINKWKRGNAWSFLRLHNRITHGKSGEMKINRKLLILQFSLLGHKHCEWIINEARGIDNSTNNYAFISSRYGICHGSEFQTKLWQLHTQTSVTNLPLSLSERNSINEAQPFTSYSYLWTWEKKYLLFIKNRVLLEYVR